MVATSDFSGLVSSACALASAAAIVPIFSLDRCMGLPLDLDEIEADRTRLRTPRLNAVTDRLLNILGHQALELRLGLLMLEVRVPRADEDVGQIPPRHWRCSYRRCGPPRYVALADQSRIGQGARRSPHSARISARR